MRRFDWLFIGFFLVLGTGASVMSAYLQNTEQRRVASALPAYEPDWFKIQTAEISQ